MYLLECILQTGCISLSLFFVLSTLQRYFYDYSHTSEYEYIVYSIIAREPLRAMLNPSTNCKPKV